MLGGVPIRLLSARRLITFFQLAAGGTRLERRQVLEASRSEAFASAAMIERVLEHEGGRENLMMRQNEAITQLLQDPPKHCASFLENLRQGRI